MLPTQLARKTKQVGIANDIFLQMLIAQRGLDRPNYFQRMAVDFQCYADVSHRASAAS